MSQYVLGVDGGGTKTHCAVFDLQGRKKGLLQWGPTNHESLSGGFDELRTELEKMLGVLLKECGLHLGDIAFGALGMAGVDTRRQHAVISGILREIGLKDFILCNDAFLGVKAGCPGGSGICAINGTGFSVAGIDPAGGMLQIGGIGQLSGDIGGGGHIAGAMVGRVYNSLFKGAAETLMTKLLFQVLGITSKYDFMDAVNEKVVGGEVSRQQLCKLVFEAANREDAAAWELLDAVGNEYANAVNGMLRELDFSKAPTVEIVLAGSVFVKGENSRAVDTMVGKIRTAWPEKSISFHRLMQPPVAGAVVWALGEARGNNDLYEKVLMEF